MARDRSVSARVAVVGGAAAASVVAAPLWFLFVARWGKGAVWQGVDVLFVDLWSLVALMAVSAAVHELLHAAGWTMAAKVPWRAVRFGFHWPTLSPYAHLTVPVAARPYRVGTALPGLVLGAAPAAAALVTGNGAWLVYGLTMLLAAGGDLFVLLMIARVPGHWTVQDHAGRVGVRVLAPADGGR